LPRAYNSDTAALGPKGLAGAIKKACPNGIDVFFDNGTRVIPLHPITVIYVMMIMNDGVYCIIVGGETLDIVLLQIRQFARIVLCGAISQYNTRSATGLRNTSVLIVNSASMAGFIVFNYAKRYK
jgi:NADPH-dependent curcumin reductase CurA